MATPDLSRRAMDIIGSVPSLIVHTIFFAASFGLAFFGIELEKILLVVTTLVSLEAIYLAIFIQMAVNQNTQSLDEVEEDLEEIQEDVEEIQEDVEVMEKDIDEIQEDMEEIQEDVDDEDLDLQNKVVLNKIESQLQNLIAEIEKIKNKP